MTRFDAIKLAQTCFCEWLDSLAFDVLSPEPLIPRDDTTVLFTNSAVICFKPLLSDEQPFRKMGVGVIQPCVRAQNLELALRDEFCGDFILRFTMFGALVPARHADPFAESVHTYLKDVAKLKPSDILFKVHADDEGLIRLWTGSGGRADSIVINSEAKMYYRWKFGTPNLTGHGATFAIRQEGGRYRDLGNLIEFRLHGIPVGYGLGFGVETLLACRTSARWVIDCASIADVIPIGTEICAKGADLISMVSALIHFGICPSRRKQGYILQKALRRLALLSQMVGWDATAIGTVANQLELLEWNGPRPGQRAAGTTLIEALRDKDAIRAPAPVQFDLSFIVPENTAPNQVAARIAELSEFGVLEAELFDVYRGSNIPRGEISVAISIKCGGDEPMRETMRRIVDAVAQEFNARLRGPLPP